MNETKTERNEKKRVRKTRTRRSNETKEFLSFRFSHFDVCVVSARLFFSHNACSFVTDCQIFTKWLIRAYFFYYFRVVNRWNKRTGAIATPASYYVKFEDGIKKKKSSQNNFSIWRFMGDFLDLVALTSNSSFDGHAAPSNDSQFEDIRFHDGHLVSIVTYSILLVISTVGNLTVLTAIWRRRRKSRTRINTMLMHLAIADLSVSIFSIILYPQLRITFPILKIFKRSKNPRKLLRMAKSWELV